MQYGRLNFYSHEFHICSELNSGLETILQIKYPQAIPTCINVRERHALFAWKCVTQLSTPQLYFSIPPQKLKNNQSHMVCS